MKFDSQMLQAYLVGGTQDVHNDVNAFLAKIELAMQNGITAFQYREKGNSKLSPAERVDLGLKLRDLATKYGVPLIVDDDYRLAQQINADGIHVGQGILISNRYLLQLDTRCLSAILAILLVKLNGPI